MKILIFTKPSCPKCPNVLKLATERAFKLDIAIKMIKLGSYDTDAIGAYYNVMSVPTVIVITDKGEIQRWVRKVPSINMLRKLINDKRIK